MEGFYLAYSTFQYAFLGPKLKDAIFNFADLSHAAIWSADMTNASFIKAILRVTKFANVQLGGSNIEQAADRSVEVFHDVKGLTKEQVVQFPRSD